MHNFGAAPPVDFNVDGENAKKCKDCGETKLIAEFIVEGAVT